MAEHTAWDNLATDIPGLRSRISNPLDMLGLYGTHHEACHRHHIPALTITGDAHEEQILAAGKVPLNLSLYLGFFVFQRIRVSLYTILRAFLRNVKKILFKEVDCIQDYVNISLDSSWS